MNTPTRSHTKLRLRNMAGEGEPPEGYIYHYEVILDYGMTTEWSFGTYDQAPTGSKSKLSSWCGEHVWYQGYRGDPKRRLRNWINKNVPVGI